MRVLHHARDSSTGRARILLYKYVAEQTATLAIRRKKICQFQDAEDVHQMRLATRRLRAAVSVINNGRGKTSADLRWLARKLGAVRDLDVLMAQLGKTPAQRAYHRYLHKHWKKSRRKLVRALQSRRMQCLIDDLVKLQRQLQTSKKRLRIDLEGSVAEQLHKVRKAGNRITPDSPFKRLHRLRINGKRLRYLIEILDPPQGASLHGVLKALKKLLITLGELQDTRMVVEHLLAYEESLEESHTDHWAVDQIVARQRGADEIRAGFPAAWRRTRKKLDEGITEYKTPIR